MKYIIIIICLLLTSCSGESNNQKHFRLLNEQTEKDIERCLEHGLGYIKHNSWRISCIGNSMPILNTNK